jgi:hypothetical protein
MKAMRVVVMGELTGAVKPKGCWHTEGTNSRCRRKLFRVKVDDRTKVVQSFDVSLQGFQDHVEYVWEKFLTWTGSGMATSRYGNINS